VRTALELLEARRASSTVALQLMNAPQDGRWEKPVLRNEAIAMDGSSAAEGMLVITPLGDGRFGCEVRGNSKWSLRQGG
jgi:hypothetical protein